MSMLVHLAVEMSFKTASGRDGDDDFEAFLDQVLTQLDAINREVNLAARIAERVADFATSIEAGNFEDAVSVFLVDLRTALHAAGCVTAGWRWEPTHRVVRELQDA
jgi:hypothetical protein